MKYNALFFLALIALVQANAKDCRCRIRTKNRIINGEYSQENSLPWIVSLARKNNHFCGGSIINEKYILTAAHCVNGEDVSVLRVRVGLVSIKDENLDGKVYTVKNVHSHKFEKPGQPDDIAIIELNEEIKFIPGLVEKSCLNFEYSYYADPLLVAGFGRTERSYFDSQTNQLVLQGKGTSLKQAFYQENDKGCEDYLICVEPLNQDDSICQGDSGGPIHYTFEGKTSIEGVASFVSSKLINGVKTSCSGNSAYTRLAYYHDWFRGIIGRNYCSSD